MNADGSGQTDLSNDPATADIDPVWSPDGTKIAWARATDTSDYDIWVMHADGTNQTQLTTDPGFDAYPAWSPDGTKIAFARRRSDGPADVYVMDADGGNETNLTNDHAQLRLRADLVAGRSADRLHEGRRAQFTGLRHERRRLRPDEPHERLRPELCARLVTRRDEDRLPPIRRLQCGRGLLDER